MFNTTTQPGPELDAKVAVILGLITGPIVEIVGGKAINARGDSVLLRPYSTEWEAAGPAWEWLEKNIPDSWDVPLALTRDYFSDKPSVVFRSKSNDMIISGETYPHAIALAVVEAGREIYIDDQRTPA